MKKSIFALVFVLSLLVAGLPAAYAELQRVGPVNNDPAVGGYPAWYQDTTGLTLEFCDPKNAAEVAGGWCLLLPPNVPNPPEVFPGEFFDEHFWYSAGADFPAGTILWESAVEAAFAGDVVPGGQIVFTRIRVRFDAPTAGEYTITHPYGEEVIVHPGGGRIFFTDDVGINCPPGQFQCAMEGRVGPFLLPSNTAGGPELPAVPGPVPGKLYIADPARSGPVTGSPFGPTRNFVRIQGPPGSNIGGSGLSVIETSNFSLMGRVFQGQIGSQLTVERASYAQPVATSSTGMKLDVFATAFPAQAARLPGQNPPAAIAPVLQFYSAPCDVNTAGGLIAPAASFVQMSSPGALNPPQNAPGSIYWGQIQPAQIPAGVCIQHVNAVGGSAFYNANVTDDVTITEAAYDPSNGGTLTVRAASSDQVNNPPLLVGGFGDINPATGLFSLSPLAAPPANVRVLSVFGGFNEFHVTTAVGNGATGSTPVAVNDVATVSEDCSVTTATSCATPLAIPVLANDTVGGQPITAGTITIVQAPAKGTAVPGAGGTVTYTPASNANGADSFTYRVRVNNVDSNVAAVLITITPVNDAPTAVADTAVAVLNAAAQLNVLGNDTDPDGPTDITAAVIVAGNATLGLTAGAVFNGAVSVTPTAGGVQTFTYRAQDAAGTLSANAATVTVNVGSAETITVQVSEFRTTNREWRVSGVISPTTTGSVTLNLISTTNPALNVPLGTAVINAGIWSFRVSGVTGQQDPRNNGGNRVRVTGPSGGTLTSTFLLRR